MVLVTMKDLHTDVYFDQDWERVKEKENIYDNAIIKYIYFSKMR